MGHFWTSPRAGRSDELSIAPDSILNSLRCPPLSEELDGEGDAVALIAAAIAANLTAYPTKTSLVRTRSRLSLTIALAAGALALTSGLAFAGQLPGAAQDTAHNVLAKLGVSVPGPNAHARTHPDMRGRSNQPAVADQGPGGAPPTDPGRSTEKGKGKGKMVSALAHTTTATGRDKGAVISTAASGGKSHAGNPPGQSRTANQHGSSTSGTASRGKSHAGNPPGQPPRSAPPAGHSGHGGSTSRTAGAGHSHAGSTTH